MVATQNPSKTNNQFAELVPAPGMAVETHGNALTLHYSSSATLQTVCVYPMGVGGVPLRHFKVGYPSMSLGDSARIHDKKKKFQELHLQPVFQHPLSRQLFPYSALLRPPSIIYPDGDSVQVQAIGKFLAAIPGIQVNFTCRPSTYLVAWNGVLLPKTLSTEEKTARMQWVNSTIQELTAAGLSPSRINTLDWTDLPAETYPPNFRTMPKEQFGEINHLEIFFTYEHEAKFEVENLEENE